MRGASPTSSGRRLLGETIAYGSAGIIGKALALLTVPILTRALSADGYGLADLATSLAAFLTLVVRFSGDIPAARMRARAHDREARRSIMSTYVVTTAVVSTVVAGGLLPLSPAIAEHLWSSPGATVLAALSLLLVPLSAVQVALVAVHRYERRAASVVVLTTLDLIAQLSLAVFFVLGGMGAVGIVAGFVVGSVVGVVAAWYTAREYLSRHVTWTVGFELVRSGLPYLPSVVGFLAADQIARILAANVLGPSEVGHFALAIRLASILALASAAFTMAWGPPALSLEPSERTRSVFSRAFAAYTACVAAVAVAVASIGPELTVFIAGRDFAPAAVAIPGLLWAGGIGGALYVLATAAGITDRGRSVALTSSIGAASQIVLTAWFITGAGLIAIALAAAAGRLIALTLLWLTVRDVVRITLPSVALIMGTSAVLVLAQVLVASPEGSLPARWVMAAAALGLGVLAMRAGFQRTSHGGPTAAL